MHEGIVLSKPLRLLDSDEIQSIHNSVIQVLDEVGVAYDADWALEILKESGCDVDNKTRKARIPENLVDEAINKSQRMVTLYGRDPKCDLRLEGTRVHFAAGGNAIRIVEYRSEGEFTVRLASVDDLVKLTILNDALENIHCYISPVAPKDVPPKGADRVKCEVAFNYTTKHYWNDAEGYEGALDEIEMASVVMGGEENLRKRSIISLSPCITSPLSWSQNALGQLKACAEKKISCIMVTEPIMGATAPATIVGAVVQGCAEMLSGLVLAQLLSPGTPTLLCILPSFMDMSTGNVVLSSIEMGKMNTVAAQVFREFYGLPYIGGGCTSESKIPDQQAGYEKALTALYASLGGANLIHLTSGMLDFLLSASLEQTVIDNEILGMIMHGLRRVDVNEETLALEAITKVGPGGQFLSQKHTLKHMTKEIYIPKISDRLSRESWEKKGAKDVVARAKDKVEEILRTHQTQPLEPDVKKRLHEIVEKAQKNLNR